jgi:exopolysaccharide biosynthesis WecB/TagA/CpsF family protein
MALPDSQSCEQVIIGGLPVARLTAAELAHIMVHDCLEARQKEQLPKLVFSSNGQCISLAGSSPEFSDTIKRADIIHADGMSVVLASWLLGRKSLPERVATTDFFHVAAKSGETNGLRFYLLGGQEEINAKAYARAKQLYPKLHWVGRHHGYFAGHEVDVLCEKIRATKPDVLWVGLGRPGQENFAVQNCEKLVGIGWIKTCGGLFDFMAGEKKRAPVWMQHAGFEWAWRMIQEPQRLIPRYAFTNLHALWRLVLYTKKE